MEKVAFSNFNLKINDEIKKIDINGIEVEVKQYLPIEDQVQIVANVLMKSAGENNFAEPIKVDVHFDLEVIFAYTNIDFSEDEKNNPAILYDLLESNDMISQIISAIPADQYARLRKYTEDTIYEYYKHANSALGIMEQITTDYKDMDFNVDAMEKKISNPANLELLKSVIEKLG